MVNLKDCKDLLLDEAVTLARNKSWKSFRRRIKFFVGWNVSQSEWIAIIGTLAGTTLGFSLSK